ncbi:CRISPR-associated protein, Csm1 family [Brevinematales bacterium NS]|nr:type III-A CRISPR-associated protein Cas10/Csm1 [Brevinematales bacterium]QJR22488.1 CRISPR-associated protein, Csm1 family [Brevinematales bacterium NS]
MTDLQRIVLASLFHDIGKFAQRTGFLTHNEIDTSKEDLKYEHAYYTRLVLNGVLEKVGIKDDNLVSLSARHHNPSMNLEWLIAEADRISSGIDREGSGGYSEQGVANTPLQSVFENLYEESGNSHVYKLGPLTAENLFPQQVSPGLNYKDHWNNFLGELGKQKISESETLYLALDTLLERWWWCIPASTQQGNTDVSLYDHSVTTAALAPVMYEYHRQKGDLEDIERIKNREEKKFLLVTGDVSGIQRYIFDLKTTSYNAKILRARSFEIQILSEVVVYEILRRLGLPIFCRIMNGGGQFILLLPNTRQTRECLSEVRTELQRHCLVRYFGGLSLNVSEGVEVSALDLMMSPEQDGLTPIQRTMQKRVQDAQKSKETKYQAVFSCSEDHVLGRYYESISSAQDICGVCEIRPRREGDTCEVCRKLINIGGRLPKATAVILKKEQKEAFLPFGWDVEIETGQRGTYGPMVFSVNAYKDGYPMMKMPYYLPQEGERILEFADLAEKSTGTKKLAMFKADVDNLGSLFAFGLGRRLSLSRYATMSRMLHAFFSLYVHYSLVQKGDYSLIYTVFSGGDDLCVLGPWDKVINYARFIRQEFGRFVSNNRVTLSGGIVLAPSSLPVRFMASQAEEALEKAKGLKDKNGVTLFSTSVKWDDLPGLMEEADRLEKEIEQNILSSVFVYRLLRYQKMRREIDEGKKLSRNLLWRSHFYYAFSRNFKQTDRQQKERRLEELVKLIEEKKLTIPVSYVSYKRREE